jgi:hypothetical protein
MYIEISKRLVKMIMSKINWEYFWENTSSTEAISTFADGDYSFKEFEEACWPIECKKIVRRLKRLGRKKALTLCRNIVTRQGIEPRSWRRYG